MRASASSITYRDARPSDRAWLFDLHAATLRQYVAETYGYWDDAVQRRMFDEKFDPSRIRIIEVDAQDVGMIELHEHEDHLLLALIEILPARQREEIGSSVIRQVLARANEENRPVELQVLRPNPARALYERLGFTVFAETPTHYRMRKRPNKSPEPTPTAVTPRATDPNSK